MSIFLKAERYGSPPLLMRARGPEFTVTADRHGRLFAGDGPDRERVFTLYRLNDRVLLVPHEEGLLAGGVAPGGAGCWVRTGEYITYEEYRIAVFGTGPAAEALAHASDAAGGGYDSVIEAASAPTPVPLVQYAVAGLSASIPLFRGLVLAAGSSDEDALVIRLAGVVASHCVFRNEGHRIVVRAGAGEIRRTAGGSAEAEILLAEGERVYLAPLDLPLAVLPASP